MPKIVQREIPGLSNGQSAGKSERAPLTGVHPVLSRIYQARGIESDAELELQLTQLIPYSSMKDITKATEALVPVVTKGKRLLVVGDFDADGATSTAVAIRALRLMGAQQLDFLVPNRFDFGYGLSPELVAVARGYQPDLIMTVDNGIASVSGVAAANDAGIPVLVTDHHLPGETLPDALAIVNPNQHGCDFPSKAACGCTVVFYLMLSLRARLTELGYFERFFHGAVPNLGQLLDLVALATVADVVPLDYNNRILVEQGLRRIRAGRAQPGVLALLQASGRDYRNLVASDLGFSVGPRINAAGRLDDMSLGIECLLTDDPGRANELAQQLDAFNRDRRQIEQAMQREAIELLDQTGPAATQDFGVSLFHPQWHQGVIGILASRIRERVYRPVIMARLKDLRALFPGYISVMRWIRSTGAFPAFCSSLEVMPWRLECLLRGRTWVVSPRPLTRSAVTFWVVWRPMRALKRTASCR